jgi:hypothetical protein
MEVLERDYIQTTGVEEINGLLSYKWKFKFDPKTIQGAKRQAERAASAVLPNRRRGTDFRLAILD